MPGLNGTGPMGQGAMTGRGRGICQGNQQKLGVGYGRSNGRNIGGNGQSLRHGNKFRHGQNISVVV
ncbi:MAG: DUF5320 domain-containing protein [Candidatus Gastranaerophilales bacterium]|nr:DUF5320 domain-containing protein [Candidatus Gastranaerophilales bacterium]